MASIAIRLLCASELDRHNFLRVCPMSGCKKMDFPDAKALIDHIFTCDFSSSSAGGETYCVACERYEKIAKEPCMDRKMDLKKSLRRISSFLSLRSNSSSASSPASTRPCSIASISGSPRLSRASTPSSAGIQGERLQPSSQPHGIFELTESSLIELSETQMPAEMSEVTVARPAELGATVSFSSMRRGYQELPTTNLSELPHAESPHGQGLSVALAPIQTNSFTSESSLSQDLSHAWMGIGAMSTGHSTSFFGDGISESPTVMAHENPDSYGVYHEISPGSCFNGDMTSRLPSMDISPSSSDGFHFEPEQTAWQQREQISWESPGMSPEHVKDSLLEQSDPMGCLPVQPVTNQLGKAFQGTSNSTWNFSDLMSPSFGAHLRPRHRPSPRTSSGSTTASSGTLASSSSETPSHFIPSSQQPPITGNPSHQKTLGPHDCSANQDASLEDPDQWACSWPKCDYRPTGKERNWPAYLRKHEDSHRSKKYKCSKCGNMFSRMDNLKTHRKGACKGLESHFAENTMRLEPVRSRWRGFSRATRANLQRSNKNGGESTLWLV